MPIQQRHSRVWRNSARKRGLECGVSVTAHVGGSVLLPHLIPVPDINTPTGIPKSTHLVIFLKQQQQQQYVCLLLLSV